MVVMEIIVKTPLVVTLMFTLTGFLSVGHETEQLYSFNSSGGEQIWFVAYDMCDVCERDL